jgi:Rrf2 family protein
MRSGLTEARAGKKGGYRLIKDPAEISLLNVVEAAEGPLRLERCTLSGGPCHWENTVCAVHSIWEDANKALTTSLRGHSLFGALEVDKKLREHERMESLAIPKPKLNDD